MTTKTPPAWAIEAARAVDELTQYNYIGKVTPFGDDYYKPTAKIISDNAPDAEALAVALENYLGYNGDIDNHIDARDWDSPENHPVIIARAALTSYRSRFPLVESGPEAELVVGA